MKLIFRYKFSFHLQIHLNPSKQFPEKKKKKCLTKTPYKTKMCVITSPGKTNGRDNWSSSHMLQKNVCMVVRELSVGTIQKLLVLHCSKNKIPSDISSILLSQSNFNFFKCILANIFIKVNPQNMNSPTNLIMIMI